MLKLLQATCTGAKEEKTAGHLGLDLQVGDLWSLHCCRDWREKEETVSDGHISREGLEIADQIYRCDHGNTPGSVTHGTGVNVAGIAKA